MSEQERRQQSLLWSGRFSEGPDDLLWSYTVSHSDRRLLPDDIEGSLAHASMLVEAGLLTPEEGGTLISGLSRIAAEAGSGEFVFEGGDEDVHSAVERRLVELVGEVGGKLHTGRSRNDQIALDVRLHLKRRCRAQSSNLARLIEVLARVAGEHAETVVASYTHLQQAQAIPLGHHLLAYAWMLIRDRDRFSDLASRLDVSPLGANASGGSSLPLRPEKVAENLGFSAIFDNSMEAVSSRDLLAEYGFVGTQAMVTLSRLAEEMVLWASSEFGWVTFADRHTTGSSALPHKKNPDIAEHARGRSADAIGALTALLTMQKGLPLAYNSDLAGDKANLFRIDDLLESTAGALAAMLDGAEFHPPAPTSWTTALDLAEALVQRGIPFRQAHQAVGRLVASLVASGRELDEAEVEDLETAHPRFEPADLGLLDASESMGRRISPGGGSPDSVRSQLRRLSELLDE